MPRSQVRISITIADAEQQRHPAALEELEQVGGEEGRVDDRPAAPSAAPPSSTGQFHSFQITMKPRMPSTTMVVVTAMP